MVKNVQTFCMGIGDGGCYALSLLKVAEKYLWKNIPTIETLYQAYERNYIMFRFATPKDNVSFYVAEPAKLLEMITGKKWTVRREDSNYPRGEDGEYFIKSWGMTGKEGEMRHFTYEDDDTLFSSPLREKGKLISLRVCKVQK